MSVKNTAGNVLEKTGYAAESEVSVSPHAESRRGNNLHVHLPTAGDHYSAATGSAIMTIIYEIARQHGEQGGRTQVIVSRGTRHDYAVGESVEVSFRPQFLDRKYKAVDTAVARLGGPRTFGSAAYAATVSAIERKFDGPLFVHNEPAALRSLKKSRPNAKVCLWANNALFRTYSRREIRRILDAIDYAVCCSGYIADDLARRVGDGCRSEKIQVVHNGVDTTRFRPGSLPLAYREKTVPVILFVGRIVPEKGPDLLLQAARKIWDPQRRRFIVRIVGSSGFSALGGLSPYEEELRRIAEPMGDAVQFQPFVDRAHILSEYQAADIFCAPSNWDDPCPLTVSEALACGLPLVASRRGGIPEIGGDAALYFAPPDISALADSLASLTDDPWARRQWGMRARARAEAFSWPNQYRTLCSAVAA